MRHSPGIVSVAPLAIGPANCEAMLGVSWRWLRDHAAELGLTVLRVDGKPFVDAAAAIDAIRRHGKAPPPPADEGEKMSDPPSPGDELAALRAKLGKRRRIG